jgi:hypothetical protein
MQEHYINTYSQTLSRLIEQIEGLKALRAEYTALDMGNQITDSHAAMLGITATQFVDAVAAIDTVISTFDAVATPVYRAKRRF